MITRLFILCKDRVMGIPWKCLWHRKGSSHLSTSHGHRKRDWLEEFPPKQRKSIPKNFQ